MVWQPVVADQFENKNNDVTVYIDSIHFSLIPDEIFNQLSKEQKESFLTHNPKDFNFFNSPVPHLSGILIWCEKKKIIDSINSKLPAANLEHFITPMLTNKLNLTQLKYYLNKDFIYIICQKEKKLQIANRFEIKTIDDALYFILSLIKESDLVNTIFNFECHGEKNEELINKLKPIFPNNQFNIYPQSDLKSIFN